jgi:hypothetical protein
MPMINVTEAVTVKAGVRRSDRQAGTANDEMDMSRTGSAVGTFPPTAWMSTQFLRSLRCFRELLKAA